MLPGVAAVERTYWLTVDPPYNFSANFNRFKLPACSADVTYGQPQPNKFELKAKPEAFPIVMFSLGFGATRFYYNVLPQFLAATGYIVVTVDHPCTTDVVEFPDVMIIKSNPNPNWTNADYDQAGDLRGVDMRFVADQLAQNKTLSNLIYPLCTKPSSVDKFGIWGHSLVAPRPLKPCSLIRGFKGA
jgi:predicted dienelactone hydrolase